MTNGLDRCNGLVGRAIIGCVAGPGHNRVGAGVSGSWGQASKYKIRQPAGGGTIGDCRMRNADRSDFGFQIADCQP